MKYKRIRSLSRGIEVLRYLNRVKGAYPVDIGKALGLPSITVVIFLFGMRLLLRLDALFAKATMR